MPPTADAESVTVASAPVAPLPTSNVEPIAASVSVRMMRSKASSEKPANAALKALRPRGPRPLHHPPGSVVRSTGLIVCLRVAVRSGVSMLMRVSPLALKREVPR